MNSAETSSGNEKNSRRIVNNTKRLVSYRGNSRKTYHIPPRDSIVVNEIEIRDLPMIKKLVSRGVIEIQSMEKASKPKVAAAKESKESTASKSSESSGEKTRKTPPKQKGA